MNPFHQTSMRTPLRMLAILFLGLLSPLAARAQSLHLTFVDVWQGDGAFIQTPHDTVVVIDAGPAPHVFADYLASHGVRSVALAVASHAHADHIGGMADVLTRFRVANYMDNGLPYTTATYRQVMSDVASGHIRYLKATPRTLTVDGVSFRILPMPPEGDDQNNHSVGVLVQYGRFSALFAGDAEGVERGYWETAGALPRLSLLKVAHHGSPNGSDPTWVSTVRPQMAIISVGTANTYHHPGVAVVHMYQGIGSRVYRTDQVGTIDVTADATGRMRVATERTSALPVDNPPVAATRGRGWRQRP